MIYTATDPSISDLSILDTGRERDRVRLRYSGVSELVALGILVGRALLLSVSLAVFVLVGG